jgi:hypothetical protein
MPAAPPRRTDDDDDDEEEEEDFATERALVELAGMKASVESTTREAKLARRIFMIILVFAFRQ